MLVGFSSLIAYRKNDPKFVSATKGAADELSAAIVRAGVIFGQVIGGICPQ
jgi:hypothetical protein